MSSIIREACLAYIIMALNPMTLIRHMQSSRKHAYYSLYIIRERAIEPKPPSTSTPA